MTSNYNIMNTRDTSWQTQAFRQSVIAKINEAVQKSGMPTFTDSIEIENYMYQRAKTKDEYLGFVARLILQASEMNTNEDVDRVTPGLEGARHHPSIFNPTSTSQTLTRQGSGNNQVMRSVEAGSDLQEIIPQPLVSLASNVLRSSNQLPGSTMNMLNMLNMQNQMQPIGMGPVQATRHHGHMGGSTQGMQGEMMMAQMNQMSPGQMRQGHMAQPISHWQQKPRKIVNAGFPEFRNITPNLSFLQHSSPSTASPASLGLPGSNQMKPSSVLLRSPNPQYLIQSSQDSNGMALSPSSCSDTPSSVCETSSPQEDQAYRNKIRQLSKYIEPLRKKITKMTNKGDLNRHRKIKRLIEILCNPSERVSLQTIVKCEAALQKFDLKRRRSYVGPMTTQMKQHHYFSPFSEAVNADSI